MTRNFTFLHLVGEIKELIVCSLPGDTVNVDPLIWRLIGDANRDNINLFAKRRRVNLTWTDESVSAAKPESPSTTATTTSVAGS